MFKRCLFITVALVFLCTSAWAQLLNSPWPKIHKDIRNSGYTSAVGTSIGKIKWRFATEKPITSSPALDNNGRIYFGSADKNLYCLDRITGSLIWKYATGDAIEHSSPAIDVNGILYIGSIDGNLYAFNTNTIDPNNPQPYWVYPTAATLPRPGIYGSPNIADDGTIIFGSADGILHALNPTNPPTVKWKAPLHMIWSTPTIVNESNTLYIGTLKNGLRRKLEKSPDTFPCPNRPVKSETYTYHNYFELDLDTGDVEWYGPNTDTVLTGIYGSIGIQPDGDLLIPTEGDGLFIGRNYGVFAAVNYPFDNATCTLIPNEALNFDTISNGALTYGTPSVIQDGSFFLGMKDTIYRFTGTGSTYFSYTTEGNIEDSTAIDGNLNVYIGCNGGVFYCFNSNSPLQPLRWRYPETGFIQKLNGDKAEIISSPAIDNDAKHSIYFGASDGAMYAFYDGASIKGTVTLEGTDPPTPLAAVEIVLKDTTNTVVATTSTDTSGNFIFSGIPGGQYTVTPKKDGYILNPTEKPVTLANLDVNGVDFVAAQAFTLTGRVVSAVDGTGLPSVSIGLVTKNASQVVVYSDNSTVTDANGYYTILNVGYGNSKVTPVLSGWGFDPPSITQPIPAGTAGGQTYTLENFQGTLGYQISGKVIDPANPDNGTNGIENVNLTLVGDATFPTKTITTNPQGTYSFTGLQNGTYKITPSLGLYKFSPKMLDLQIQNASKLNQNFYGATGLTISGNIKLPASESSYDGFSVNLYKDDETFWSKIFNRNKPRTLVATATVSSPGGFFIFMGIDAGKYVVEPSAAGYGFSPASTKVTALTDVANLIFTASAGFTISGKVTNIFGIGQSNFAVNLVNNASSADAVITYTNSDGSYTFTGLEAGTYTVIPDPSSFYVVTPTSRSVTVLLESVRKVNFFVISFCSKTYITLPFWGADGDTVYVIGTNFGPPPTDNTTSVAVTLSDGTEVSVPAGVYFGTSDPETWVSAKFSDWTPVYITAKVPLLDGRLMKVWVVKPGLTTCITIEPTNFFINTRM
jgi:outer membrane protein assembly factor BamB